MPGEGEGLILIQAPFAEGDPRRERIADVVAKAACEIGLVPDSGTIRKRIGVSSWPDRIEAKFTFRIMILKPDMKGAEPVVINLRKAAPGQANVVYIGRPSKWGNPFQSGNRARDLADYEAYLRRSPELLEALAELSGKYLGCFCKPKACHGDILVKLWRERFGWITVTERTQRKGKA